MLRISTNIASLSAQRNLRNTGDAVSANFRKLSTGERITRSADDAAGLAISENLKSQIRSIRQCKRNAGDAVGLIQTAEGGLAEISSMLIRLRELGMQAASDTIGDSERRLSNLEFQNLKEEIDRVARSSQFNGIKLLDGTGGILEFQIGVQNDPILDRQTYDTTAMDATIGSLGIATTDISSKVGAQSSLATLDNALVKINGSRAVLGAKQNRLNSTISNLDVNDENMSSANSRIRDVDIAEETAALAKNKILMQAGMSVLGQANQSPSVALKLLE